MTLQEFKAWFEGFNEVLDGKLPSKKQWARIQERVSQIDGHSVTATVIHEWWPRYVRTYPTSPYYHPSYWVSGGGGGGTYCGGSKTLSASGAIPQNSNVTIDYKVSNPLLQLSAMGAAEASSLTN